MSLLYNHSLHVNFLYVIRTMCVTSRIHPTVSTYMLYLKSLPEINRLELLLDDVEYFCAY